jgi:iron(III) transport system substrate-binding protein
MIRFIALVSALAFGSTASAQEVNIYSSRQIDLIEPVLEAFTAETGIYTNVLFLKSGLIDRIAAEGRGTAADVILMTDIGNLLAATAEGITQPVQSETLKTNIPATFRDQGSQWFGLTLRGRVVYASVDRVAEDELTYEDLADPKFKGRICTRSGQHPYNIALIASIIDEIGEQAAQEWLEGLRDNLARKPEGNDRAQAKGIYAGECDLGLGNTYYVGLMETNDKEPEQKEWRKSMKVIFPNANDRGTHVNVSGMAMTKHSRNSDEALKLMEFLSSPAAQTIYAEQVFEYPVIDGAAVSDIVASFGELKADPRDLNAIGSLRARASELVDIVGYNDGPR